MKYFSIVFIVAIIVLACCNDNVVSPIINGNIYQKGKCIGTGLAKFVSDSCFNYTFNDKLIIDFCVDGNCCPDSNRFVITKEIISDTIKIFVQDVAPNLCRCICKYLIHAEFNNLTSTNLMVNCYRIDGTKQQILYSQRVRIF